MRRSRNKDDRRKDASTAVMPEGMADDEERDSESRAVPDVLIRINYTLLLSSLAVLAVCALATYFVHNLQVRKHVSRLKVSADAAEAEGDARAAIGHLTRYLRFLREQPETAAGEIEQTETLVHLGTLHSEFLESRPDQNLAFGYFEEALRNDPARDADRRRQIEVCMKLGRYRDALEHLDLFEADRTLNSDPVLLSHQVRAQIGRREFVKAQQSYCRLIAVEPENGEHYTALASLIAAQPGELWSPAADEVSTLFPDDTPPVLRAFPQGDEERSTEQSRRLALKTTEQRRRVALKAVVTLLDILIESGQPAWDAQRRRADFLVTLGPTFDAAAEEQAAAKIRSSRLMNGDEFDKDRDGVLNVSEAQSADVPAFADINRDGRIDQDELTRTLEAGGQFRRLSEAQWSIDAALSLVPPSQSGESGPQSQVLSTASDVYLALAEAWEYEDYKRAQEYIAKARNVAAQAVTLSESSPASLLAKARLELRLLRFEQSADVDARRDRLDQAASLLDEARQILTKAEGEGTSKEGRNADNSQALLNEIELTLGHVLVAQLQDPQNSDGGGLKSRIREELIPSLKARAAPAHLVELLTGELLVTENRWREAEAALRSAAAGLSMNSDFLRRLGLLRAECARRLADSESYLARTLSVHQADASWARGRVALAQAYQDSGNIDAAITEYARFANNPEITPILARLLIRREQLKPFAERNWKPVENALERLEKGENQEQNAALVPVLRSDVLFLQAVTDQFVYQEGKGAGLAEGAKEKLQQADQLLRQAADRFPADVDIRRAWTFLTVIRFDLSIEERLKRSDDILRLAHEELGDSVSLRLANAVATRLLPQEAAIAALKELHQENPEFSPQDRASLLISLAGMYAGRGDRESAIDACIEASRLVPTEITYPQAALGHLIAFVMQNKGKIGGQQSHWDALLAHLGKIEGANGPLSAYYRGALIVLTVAGEPDRLGDPQVASQLEQARTLLYAAQQERQKWSAIPRMLGELEMLDHVRALRNGDESRFQQAAIAQFETAAALGDLGESVVARLVEFYLQNHREPDAQRILDRVARERPQGLSDQLATLAWRVESQLDEPSRAIDAYLKQAEGFGEGGQKVRAALMLMGRGETGPEVEQLLLDACELEPQASAPWEWIVRYYIQRTRLLAARDKIDEAEQALPDDPPFLKPRTLARCYRLLARAGKDQAEQQRAAEQAERHYTAAVDAAPDSMSLYRERTEYFIETNQFDKARQSLAKVLDPQLNVPREVRLWAEHSTALVTASGGTFDDLTRGLELLRAAEVDTVEQRIFNLRSQLDVLARRNRVADRKEMVRLLEQLREVAGVRFTLNEQLQLAALYEAAGDWPKAEAEFETLLNPDPPQSGPRDPAVIAGYALAMLRQKGPFDDERIERLNRFVEELKQLAPGALETALIEARLLHAQGRSAEAVPVLLAYLDTLNVQAPEASLRNLIEQKDVDRAVELLKAALRSRKDEGLARVVPHLEGLLRQQNTEEALSVLERYLSVSELAVSVQTEMLRVVAGLLEEVGETRAAEDLLRKYVAKAPQPAEAAMALVGFLGRQDRIDEALDKCEQVWNMLADPTRAAENSVALVRHGKPTDRQISRVEQLLLDAIKRSQDPKVRVQYQIFVADLRDVQLRTDEAVQIYEAILKVNDRDLVALNNLAWMLAFQPGREAQALTLINRAIELAGPAPAFRDTRASISLRLNKPQQAVDDLVEAIDQAGDDPELWFHLSQAYLQTGDREQAREAFRNAEGKGLKLESLHRLQHDGYRKLQQEFGEKQSDSVTWSENP